MPQANDAELTELYTTETGVNVENNEPNALLGSPAPDFDLRLQAVAGSVIGAGSGDYTLRIWCVDETLAQPAPATMGPFEFDQEYNADTGNDWLPSGPNFVKEQTIRITVPAGVEGHVFRYYASMVSDNDDVVSFIESNLFTLVDP
jgi:hypothetical protein